MAVGRQYPNGVSRQQVAVIDGVRVAVRSIELTYARLKDGLYRLAGLGVPIGAVNIDPEVITADDEFSDLLNSCFTDAWAIVDNVHRTKRLLRALPGLKQNTPWHQIFQRATKSVEELRHGIQHIDERLDQLASTGASTWGTLDWWTPEPIGGGPMHLAVIGALHVGTTVTFGPLQGGCERPAGLIRLSAYEHVASITRIVTETRRASGELERALVAGEVRPGCADEGAKVATDIVVTGALEVAVTDDTFNRGN